MNPLAHEAALAHADGFLRASTSVLIGIVAADGTVTAANDGFARAAARTGEAAAAAFRHPEFADLAARASAVPPGTVVHRGVLNLHGPRDVARSMRGVVVAAGGGGLVVLVEHDAAEYEALTTRLAAINEELVTAQRRLARESRERARAADAHRATAEYARGLLEASADATLVVGEDGRVRDANVAAVRAAGIVDARALVGHGAGALFADGDEPHDLVREAFHAGASAARLLTLRGSGVRALVNATRVTDATGAPAALLVARDVTELLRLQEEAQRQREVLWRQERYVAFGNVAMGLAHEVNNPLMFIIGSLDMARQDVDEMGSGGARPAEAAESLREALDRATRGATRIRDLVSAVQAIAPRRLRGSAERLDARELASRAADLARLQCREAVHVHVDAGDAPAPVLGHADDLVAALMHLVANAADAAGAGGGHVRVIVRADDERVRVRVEDDGPGIPPDAREHLFAPFYTTKDAHTGLGLAAAARIAHEHDGTVHADAGNGPGAAFTLTLPRATGKDA